MRRKLPGMKVRKLTVVLALLVAGLTLPPLSRAALVELPGVAYDVNAAMADNLRGLLGKKVRVTLSTGATFSGSVKAVGNELLHLEKIEGKEYFDALIRINEIGAIDTRFRDYQP